MPTAIAAASTILVTSLVTSPLLPTLVLLIFASKKKTIETVGKKKILLFFFLSLRVSHRVQAMSGETLCAANICNSSRRYRREETIIVAVLFKHTRQIHTRWVKTRNNPSRFHPEKSCQVVIQHLSRHRIETVHAFKSLGQKTDLNKYKTTFPVQCKWQQHKPNTMREYVDRNPILWF